MYYTENNNNRDNFRFMLIFLSSLLLHIALILLIPTIYEEFRIEEIKEEKIRASLVSFVEEKEKKVANTTKEVKKKEELLKREEVKKQEEPKKIVEEKKEVKKEVIEEAKVKEKVEVKKKLPVLTGPVRKERDFDVTNVTSTKVEGTLREINSTENIKIETNIDNSLGLKGEDKLDINIDENRKLKEVEENITNGDFEKIKIGEDYQNATAITNLKENIISTKDIKGEDTETKLPKNIANYSTNVDGGKVEFRRFTSPSYPEVALRNAQSGSVEVEFDIKGSMTIFRGIVAKSGYPSIDRAVEEAAKTWQLEIKKDGLFVDGKVKVKVEFDLKSKS